MSPPDVKFSQEYVVYPPRKQGVYLLPHSDWKRLRRLIATIVSEHAWYQNLASLCFGVLFSAVFTMIALPPRSTLPPWVWPTCWAFAVSSVVLGLVFVCVDRSQRKGIHTSVSGVLAEMDAIQQTFDDGKEADTEGVPPTAAALSASVAPTPGPPTRSPDLSFRPGERVRHPQFGVGTVIAIEPYDKGNDEKITVRFSRVGTKRLLVKYARLERTEA